MTHLHQLLAAERQRELAAAAAARRTDHAPRRPRPRRRLRWRRPATVREAGDCRPLHSG